MTTRRISFYLLGWVLILFVALCLAGCATLNSPPTSKAPVCEALIGPIKYNSQVRTSRRFAGPDLAPDLRKRNAVGHNLRCKQYR